jgi:hypothetical protein
LNRKHKKKKKTNSENPNPSRIRPIRGPTGRPPSPSPLSLYGKWGPPGPLLSLLLLPPPPGAHTLVALDARAPRPVPGQPPDQPRPLLTTPCRAGNRRLLPSPTSSPHWSHHWWRLKPSAALLSPSPPLSINRTHPSSSPSLSSLSFPHSLPPCVVAVSPEPRPAHRRRRAEARRRSPFRPLGHALSCWTVRALLTRTPCSPSPPCTRASAQGRRRPFCVWPSEILRIISVFSASQMYEKVIQKLYVLLSDVYV